MAATAQLVNGSLYYVQYNVVTRVGTEETYGTTLYMAPGASMTLPFTAGVNEPFASGVTTKFNQTLTFNGGGVEENPDSTYAVLNYAAPTGGGPVEVTVPLSPQYTVDTAPLNLRVWSGPTTTPGQNVLMSGVVTAPCAPSGLPCPSLPYFAPPSTLPTNTMLIKLQPGSRPVRVFALDTLGHVLAIVDAIHAGGTYMIPTAAKFYITTDLTMQTAAAMDTATPSSSIPASSNVAVVNAYAGKAVSGTSKDGTAKGSFVPEDRNNITTTLTVSGTASSSSSSTLSPGIIAAIVIGAVVLVVLIVVLVMVLKKKGTKAVAKTVAASVAATATSAGAPAKAGGMHRRSLWPNY